MTISARRKRQRTNIELDVEYVATIMERYHLPTKTAAVDLALETLAGRSVSVQDVLTLEGRGEIEPVPDGGPHPW